MKQTKEQILAKLNGIAKPATTWLEQAQYREDNYEDIKKAQKIALIVLRTIRARKMSQKALAEKIGTTPQLVNKWLKGKENFTLGTIDKLERALNIELIHIVQPKPVFTVLKASAVTIHTQAPSKRYANVSIGKIVMAPKSTKKEVERGFAIGLVAEPEFCYG